MHQYSDVLISGGIDVSVIMPCLNEADTLATCIGKAREGLKQSGLVGEIIVADNGSTDGSQEIARSVGATVIDVSARGYGHALIGGIAASRGRYVIMGDADDSYDFREIPAFVEGLRAGADVVQGCRLSSGGGKVMPGAMPLLHRVWGNPMFSMLAQRWFRAPIHDVYCGLRGFTRDVYERLDLRCTGMEFATEMIIKASLQRVRIDEVPITLHPDGRRTHPPHLRTFRDGWRTLRFFLLYSPRWLFLVPGAALILLGLIGYAIALPRLSISGIHFDAHTLLFASLFIICGYQSIVFAVLSKLFATTEGLLPPDSRLNRALEILSLERGLLIATFLTGVGGILLVLAVQRWFSVGFGSLDYASTMRLVIPGVTLSVLGFQSMLWSFFGSILGLHRRT